MPAEQIAADDAVQQSHEALALLDPETTWGISLELGFEAPISLDGVEGRLAALVAAFPHLGAVPTVERAGGDWDARRESHASEPLGDHGRLVRVLVSEDLRTVFLTAHHGMVDGLGMLAIGEAVTQAGLRFEARGIGDRPATRSFLWSSLLRLGEALFTPPARFSGRGTGEPGPERLDRVVLPPRSAGTATLCTAVARTYGRWPRGARSGGRRFLVVMGVSRRVPGVLAADRQTAYIRIPVEPTSTVEEARALLASTEPEPDLPEGPPGRVGPALTRALRSRLGATAILSNLGVVTGENLRSAAMYPALNGPQAVGFGVVSTSSTTTVSLRTRRADFDAEEAERLLGLFLEQLGSAQ